MEELEGIVVGCNKAMRNSKSRLILIWSYLGLAVLLAIIMELLSTTTTYTGLAAKTISYAYYPNGSRQTMTTPAGNFGYSYDAGGRPSSMTNPFSETTSWGYQNNNWLATQTLANGLVATYTHNALGQVTGLLNQIGSTTISDFNTIAYDGIGNRTSVTANIPGAISLSGTTGYAYDSKDQITQETSTRSGGFTDNFGYDSAGNPTNFKGVTKVYNSNNQQTGTGFTHDGNGNPTNYGGTTLTFDPENRMTAYGSLLTAGYNGDGLRAWKENSSSRTYFLYDGIVPVVEIDSSANVIATNAFGSNGLVSRREGSTSVFYSFDSEGNVAQRSDASGTVFSNHLFSAHGGVLGGISVDPFGHKAQVGYYTDNETGLQLLTHRYYDPNSGRFLTRDPISYSGGVNLYGYTRNNPVNFIDPLGLDVLVIEQGPHGDNPFGHTALAITGRGVFSFGNGREMATDTKGNIVGGNVADYIERESQGRVTNLLIIKTTPAQDAAIESALRAMAQNEPALPQDKSIVVDNCSTRSNRALDAGDVTNRGLWPSHHIPGSAGLRAMHSGSSVMTIPQGAGWLPTSLEGFMPKH